MPRINRFKTIVAAALLFALFAGYAIAQPVPLASPLKGDLTVQGIISKIAGVIFWLGLMIAPIAIIWGGFEIATAGGDQSKVTKGKQIIFYSIIGLVIIGISMTLATVIQNVLTD